MHFLLKSGGLLGLLLGFCFPLAAMNQQSYTQVPQSLTMERRLSQKLTLGDLTLSDEQCNNVINQFTESSCQSLDHCCLDCAMKTSWATIVLTSMGGIATCIAFPFFTPCGASGCAAAIACEVCGGALCCLEGCCIKSEINRRRIKIANRQSMYSPQHLFWDRLMKKYDSTRAEQEEKGLVRILHSPGPTYVQEIKKFAGRSDVSIEELRSLAQADFEKSIAFLKSKSYQMSCLFLWVNEIEKHYQHYKGPYEKNPPYHFYRPSHPDILNSAIWHTILESQRASMLNPNSIYTTWNPWHTSQEYLFILDEALKDMPATIFKAIMNILVNAEYDTWENEKKIRTNAIDHYLKKHAGDYGKCYLRGVKGLEEISEKAYKNHPLFVEQDNNQLRLVNIVRTIFDNLLTGNQERQLNLRKDFANIGEFKQARDQLLFSLPTELWWLILYFLPSDDKLFSVGWPAELVKMISPEERKRWALEKLKGTSSIKFYYQCTFPDKKSEESDDEQSSRDNGSDMEFEESDEEES